ncbi:MAG: ATP-binding cassette domain-containing protein [Butyrivibrio sp.]|jgi:predicted ATP-binding protein involved in virulence|nr:ATP-binding cassette domain-containing protein [Butyrivibrio sp.]
MYDIYLKSIKIESLRHLKNVTIPISDSRKKNLIITGKNGSGKTSLLKAITEQLNYLTTQGDFDELMGIISNFERTMQMLKKRGASDNELANINERIQRNKRRLADALQGISLEFNVPENGIKSHFDEGSFIVAFYEADRKFDAIIPTHVEKVNLKDNYMITESPRNDFVKYILDLKMTEALAKSAEKEDKALKIQKWFLGFEKVLKKIFQDDSTTLCFNEETFGFSIKQSDNKEFSFQELSDGYAAVLDIVVDLMVRMEKHNNGIFNFDLPGIVLIDEIETHLHLELQRNVLDLLTALFPNIQFIISTHSPFVISSANNATLYDLENKTLVSDGLTNLPYDGIVTGYFQADNLSKQLREKFDSYKSLVSKKNLSDDDMNTIAELELYLDEIPDYLALDVTTEYRRLKTEFDNREDF